MSQYDFYNESRWDKKNFFFSLDLDLTEPELCPCMQVVKRTLDNPCYYPSCPVMKNITLTLNSMSINCVNESFAKESNKKYAKHCFDCDVQMDSCVLVGFYVFRLVDFKGIVLSQKI